MATPPRRSGRTRKANTKYANNTWGKETLRLLRESSESSNPTSIDSEEEPLPNDGEFDQGKSRSASIKDVQDEDNLSIASRSSKSSRATNLRDEVVSDIGIEDDGSKPDPVTNSTHEVEPDHSIEDDGGEDIMPSRWKQPTQTHSRGVGLVDRGKSIRGGIWQAMFGPEVDDLRPMLEVKERWLYNVRDTTLPSWTTMEDAKQQEWKESLSGGDCHLASATGNTQEIRTISYEDASRRQFLINGTDQKILLGPRGRQKIYELPYMKPVNLGQAWRKNEDDPDSCYYSGWLINAGEKPQCMAWSKHQSNGQYLALACRSTPHQRDSVPKPQVDISPAFTPSAPYPINVQIWRIATTNGNKTKSSLHSTQQPKLVQLLLCNSGDIKQMMWCPEPVNENESTLGKLALVTSDGCARIVNVTREDLMSDEPFCVEVTTPAIKIDPPQDAVFTCFAFASPTDLILGTSSGHIHIYNLSQSSSSGWEPYYLFQLHQTYITALSTLPGDESHFLASASAAGIFQITDLRSPIQDTVSIPRARVPTRNLVCSRHCRAFLTTIDSSGNTEPRGNAQTNVVAHSLRHFYTAVTLSKFPEGSGVSTALRGSELHPYLLMGNSQGTVWTQNVIRRMLPMGKPGSHNDGGAWVQKVIEHEWVPRSSDPVQRDVVTSSVNDADVRTVDYHHGPPVRPGTSRLHFGFKPEKLDLSNVGDRKRKVPAGGPDVASAIQVIFEEEQAVSAIEWSCNPTTASCCAIGWGSGLVLVTDLGHDTA